MFENVTKDFLGLSNILKAFFTQREAHICSLNTYTVRKSSENDLRMDGNSYCMSDWNLTVL